MSKFHVSGWHSKRNCLQDRANLHKSREWQLLISNTVFCSMMTSWFGKHFRITVLCDRNQRGIGEFIMPPWAKHPATKTRSVPHYCPCVSRNHRSPVDSNVERWCFLRWWSIQTIEQIVELLVIWDTITLMNVTLRTYSEGEGDLRLHDSHVMSMYIIRSDSRLAQPMRDVVTK